MIEMRETAPGEVTLWEDGQIAGGAAWTMATLAWGRERAAVARLSRFEAQAHNRPALRAYLEFLWAPLGVAAVEEPRGELRWLHRGLEESWRGAGAPTESFQA